MSRLRSSESRQSKERTPAENFVVEKATLKDFAEVRALFDAYSSGVYGFVPDCRIKRHIREGGVHVVRVNGEIVAAAIGRPGETLWNIMVKPEYRHAHLGTALVSAVTPEKIRVKCRPHAGMSKEERDSFVDPTPFYERLGYVFEKWDYPRNYYLGKDQVTGKALYITQGEIRSIKIMRKLKPGEKAPEPDKTCRPKVLGSDPGALELKPRVRS